MAGCHLLLANRSTARETISSGSVGDRRQLAEESLILGELAADFGPPLRFPDSRSRRAARNVRSAAHGNRLLGMKVTSVG
jgi:hypothetical protein